MALVSVIIPVYNVAPFLEESLKTVQKQTLSDLEILLIDDGSTDGSGEICDKLCAEDSRIHTVHTENGGVSHARNTGIPLAQGKYIYFCDPDDLLVETLLEDNVALAEQNEADIVVFGHYVQYYESGKISEICNPLLNGTYSRAAFKKDFHKSLMTALTVWTRIFKTEFIRKNALTFVKQPIAEDAIFCVSAYGAPFNRVVFNQTPYYYHLLHGASSMAKYIPEIFDYELTLSKKVKEVALSLQEKDLNCTAVAHFFYVRTLSIAIGNMAEKTCPLSYPDKVRRIKEMLRVPDMAEAVKKVPISSFLRKSEAFKLALLKCKLYIVVILLGELKKKIAK